MRIALSKRNIHSEIDKWIDRQANTQNTMNSFILNNFILIALISLFFFVLFFLQFYSWRLQFKMYLKCPK